MSLCLRELLFLFHKETPSQESGLVTDTYEPLTQEAEDDQEFKAILSFLESSLAAWDT